MRRRGVDQHDDFDGYDEYGQPNEYDEFGYDGAGYDGAGYDGAEDFEDDGGAAGAGRGRHGAGRHERDYRVAGRHEGTAAGQPHGRHERHLDEHGRHGRRGDDGHDDDSGDESFDYDVDDYDDYDDDIGGLFGDETAPISRGGHRTLQRSRREVERRRRRAGPKLVAMIVVIAALLGIGIYGVGKVVGRIGGGESMADYPGPGTGETEVQVVEGATIRDIAKVLVSLDVVGSEGAFVAVAAADPDSIGIQPGYYRLRFQMSAEGALEALLDPSANSLSRFTIPEGSTVAQIIAALSERTGVAVSEYQKVIDNPAELGLPPWTQRVEGYLFPSTYDLVPGATPAATLKMFVDKFHSEVATLDFENAAAVGNMSPAEVVIVASIIEEEVARQEDGPRVARVIYNRLNDSTGAFTRLDMDSTTRYALGLSPDQPLTQENLNDPNPYNTRAVAGLPPGAISNPGLWALKSALRPEPGSWLYFVSLPRSGKTIFATTGAEWAAALRLYEDEGGG